MRVILTPAFWGFLAHSANEASRPLTDIPVAETAQAVIALHDALELIGIEARQRIEPRTATPRRILFSTRHPVQTAFRFGGTVVLARVALHRRFDWHLGAK